MKIVKTLAKTLTLALIAALVCASMLVPATASEGPLENEGHMLAYSTQDEDRYREESHTGHTYGTQLRPEGLDLGFGGANAPALHNEVRIPPLAIEEQVEPTPEGIVPITEFVPAPHTGYASSLNMVVAAAILLGAALALARKKLRPTS